MIRLLIVLACAGAWLPTAAHAQMDNPNLLAINPGVKLAYTFGEGFTLGLELSVVVVPEFTGTDIIDLVKRGIAVGYGFVFGYDYTFKARVHRLHGGVEWIGPGIGLETGPTFVRDPEGSYFGWNITAWAGYYTLPFFNYTLVAGRDNLAEIGLLAKLHLCARDCPEEDID